MKGKFDNISKGTWKYRRRGVSVDQGKFIYPLLKSASGLNITDQEEVKQNYKLAAFAGNIAQKYNIEHFEEIVEALKLLCNTGDELKEFGVNIHDLEKAKKALKSIEKS